MRTLAIAAAAIALMQAGVAPAFGQWLYSEAIMSGTTTVFLRVDAFDRVSVWERTVRPTLLLQCRGGTFDAFVALNTPQGVERGQIGSVRVQFDSDPMESQEWQQSANGDALFSQSSAAFLERLRKTRVLLFEFTPANAEPVVVPFNTTGLEERVGRLLEACPSSTGALTR